MHITFRQYAQQMGMQNVRAILPEQIDILINQSITDTVNQLIRENIGITNDRVVTDNSKIGQINAFRTLYDVKEVSINIGTVISSYRIRTTVTLEEEHVDVDEIYYVVVDTNTTIVTSSTSVPNSETVETPQDDDTIPSGHIRRTVVVCTEFTYSTGNFVYEESNRLQGLIKHTNGNSDAEDPVFGRYMFLVDISINYSTENIITPWYPVRIIDSAYLADTLNDFVLKNRFRSPIACVYKNDTIELYIDKFKSGTTPQIEIKSGINTINLTPYKLRIDLIKYPAIVKFVEDIGGGSVSCDLPDSMHGDIVKHAVDLYRVAVNGSLQASQEAEQAQQRENVRNNYRNEGNK